MQTPHPAATRTVVMSGATRGLGRAAARMILEQAPDVHLVLLARADGEQTAAQLRTGSGNPHVTSVVADLASVGSLLAAGATVRDEVQRGVYPRVSSFVGNAGVQLLRATDASVDGVETTFAVNVLANYVLVQELRPALAPSARVVLTASDTHFGDLRHNLGMVPAPLWRDPVDLAAPGTAEHAASAHAGRRAYSTSKLATVYLTHALARRLAPDTDVYSFNPGLVPGTGLARDGGAAARFAFRYVMPAMTVTPWARSAAVSGAHLAALAVGPAPGPSGSYVNGASVEDSSRESYDLAREDDLLGALARLVATTSTSAAPG